CTSTTRPRTRATRSRSTGMRRSYFSSRASRRVPPRRAPGLESSEGPPPRAPRRRMRHPILLVLLAGPLFTAGSVVQAPERVAAAERGDAARVRALLESGAPPDARDEKGVTALLAAVRGGSTEVVRLLIRTGAHVDASTATGWTPLMETAARGRVEAAGLLIDAGAD